MQDATAHRLALSLATLMRGRLYPGSEGDTPYQAFSAPHTGRLTVQSFGIAADAPRGWAVELRDARPWFEERSTGSPDVPDDEAEVYALLSRVMHAALGPRLHLAAAIPPLDRLSRFHKTRRYVIGRHDTHLVGLVAFSVET